ncbi:MAG TPA: hypothetical protein VFT50_00795 [Baekduia sp.]|nr:hypothetical protein [Baekduia sp.]
MLRAARPLLALALLLAVAAPGAHAASTAHVKAKRCTGGKIRLVAHGRCVKLPAPSSVAARRPLAAEGAERRFTKLAGHKAARRAATLARRLAGAAQAHEAARRPQARAAATEVDDNGGWHDLDLDGVPGRIRNTTTTTDGDVPSETVVSEAEATQQVDGATVTSASTSKLTRSFTACPDRDGVVTGHIEITKIVRKTVVRDGTTAFVETRTVVSADLDIQIADDATIASATYHGTFDVQTRGTGATTRRYLSTWSAPAPLPHQPRTDVLSRVQADPAAVDGVYRGPKGDRLSEQELIAVAALRIIDQERLEQGIQSMLELLESDLTGDSDCVKVVAIPASASLRTGEQASFSVTAHAKDGQPVGGPGDVLAARGTATPSGPIHTDAGTPLSVQFTMGDKGDADIFVTIHSKRGSGIAQIPIKHVEAPVYDVTFTGTGTYTKHVDRGDTDDMSAELSWTTTLPGMRFDGGTFSPMATTSLAGSLHQSGTLGTGTYSCDAAPMQPPVALATATTPDGRGAVAVRVVPFSGVVPELSTEQCQRAGYGGDYGHAGGILDSDPYTAIVTVTPDLLQRDEFTIPVHRAADFSRGCAGEDGICVENGDMSGTLRFVRR